MLKREENIVFVAFPLKGLTIKRCAVALLALLSGMGSFDIFSSASASPIGYLVKSAPDASAKNSLPG